MRETMLEIIRAAILAPSGHNAQPWKFSIRENEYEIRILPDFSRRLPFVDPDDRELYISIGCALENLRIACGHFGFDTEVEYFPDDASDCVRVTLSKSLKTSGGLYRNIPVRQSNRFNYDGKPIPDNDLDELSKVRIDDGIFLKLLSSVQEMEPVIRASAEGCRQKYADRTFLYELEKWLRFNEKEARESMDGLYTACVGAPSVPRWLGKRFLYGTSPEKTAQKDERKLRSSGALALFSSESDDRFSWIKTGCSVERFALTAAGLHIKTAFVSQALQIPTLRFNLLQEAGLSGKYPQFLVRLGYAPDAPNSFRRPVEQVFRNDRGPEPAKNW